jgi:nucleoside-diphosphate-sugar epimerase
MNRVTKKNRIIVTGATGFAGQAIVAAARRQGFNIHALARSKGRCPESWANDPAIIFSELDLSQPGVASKINEIAKGSQAIIHAAAAMGGDDARHKRDTIGATRSLLEGVCALKTPPRLVLVSSLSVYGYAAMPEWSTLDETTPVEINVDQRDAYCRAKLEQEALVIHAVQSKGLAARIIRPGAIYDPNHKWTARLGFSTGPRVICVGGDAPIPAIHVDHCAEILVLAASKGMTKNDIPIPRGTGQLEIINAIDPLAPKQKDWINAYGYSAIYLPHRPLKILVNILTLAADLVPWFFKILPSLAHESSFSARFKPLHYSNARLEDRLGYRPGISFFDALNGGKHHKDG